MELLALFTFALWYGSARFVVLFSVGLRMLPRLCGKRNFKRRRQASYAFFYWFLFRSGE